MAYISAAESIRISSTTFTQSAQNATEFGEITQPLGLLRRSRSFKVFEFGSNRKPICDFLLVNSTYLLSYTFLRYSLGKVQNRYIFLPLFGLTPQRRGSPGTSPQNFTWMSSGHQRIKWHRNIAENFNRLSRVHERYRQTDRRQTDRRTTTYSEHEHEFTFAKK